MSYPFSRNRLGRGPVPLLGTCRVLFSLPVQVGATAVALLAFGTPCGAEPLIPPKVEVPPVIVIPEGPVKPNVEVSPDAEEFPITPSNPSTPIVPTPPQPVVPKKTPLPIQTPPAPALKPNPIIDATDRGSQNTGNRDATRVDSSLNSAENAQMDLLEETRVRVGTFQFQDPNRAISQYKLFLGNGQRFASVKVQAGVLIAQLRYAMGDVRGSLSTCDALLRKYSSCSLSPLLSLQKAVILGNANQREKADALIQEARPGLLDVEPRYYPLIERDFIALIRAVQSAGRLKDLESGSDLCLTLEELYLKWLKVPSIELSKDSSSLSSEEMWTKFGAIETLYKQLGREQEAQDVRPKVVDALLQMEGTSNETAAGTALEAARWRIKDAQDEGLALYTKAIALAQKGSVVRPCAILERNRILLYIDGFTEVQQQPEEEQQARREIESVVRDIIVPTLVTTQAAPLNVSPTAERVLVLRMQGMEILARYWYDTGGFEDALYWTNQAEAQYKAAPLPSTRPLLLKIRDIERNIG